VGIYFCSHTCISTSLYKMIRTTNQGRSPPRRPLARLPCWAWSAVCIRSGAPSSGLACCAGCLVSGPAFRALFLRRPAGGPSARMEAACDKETFFKKIIYRLLNCLATRLKGGKTFPPIQRWLEVFHGYRILFL
jgi:hypothetical protein